jgi:hypothetical protein
VAERLVTFLGHEAEGAPVVDVVGRRDAQGLHRAVGIAAVLVNLVSSRSNDDRSIRALVHLIPAEQRCITSGSFLGEHKHPPYRSEMLYLVIYFPGENDIIPHASLNSVCLALIEKS